jgi:hypothetical protein
MIKMKTKIIIITIVAFLFLANTVFSKGVGPEGGGEPPPINPQPELEAISISTSTSPTSHNPLPVRGVNTSYPLTIYFDNYFPPLLNGNANLYAFLLMNQRTGIESSHILDIETQSWIPGNIGDQDWWDYELPNKLNFILSYFGVFDHFPSYREYYPEDTDGQEGGFYNNEINYPELGRVVYVKVRLEPIEGYLLNEEQFTQFILQGYTNILIQKGPDENMR